MNQQANRPVKEFKAGSLRAAVWVTQTQKNGRTVRRFSVSFNKRFRTPEGTWQSTSVLFPNDIPKARLVLGKAFEFCLTAEQTAAPPAP